MAHTTGVKVVRREYHVSEDDLRALLKIPTSERIMEAKIANVYMRGAPGGSAAVLHVFTQESVGGEVA